MTKRARKSASPAALTRSDEDSSAPYDMPAHVRSALKDAEWALDSAARPAQRDPQHGDEVERLGLRIGFGALMTSASASWAARQGGGAFASGPCISTVANALAAVRAALAESAS